MGPPLLEKDVTSSPNAGPGPVLFRTYTKSDDGGWQVALASQSRLVTTSHPQQHPAGWVGVEAGDRLSQTPGGLVGGTQPTKELPGNSQAPSPGPRGG